MGGARGVAGTPQERELTAPEQLATRGRPTGRGGTLEVPGHPSWREQIEWAGASWQPIGIDDEGLRAGELAASPGTAVLTTPAHQWPTGVVLSARRRVSLVDWARTTGSYLIEDDYDAEYRYDRDPVMATSEPTADW